VTELAQAVPGHLVSIAVNPITEPFWTAAKDDRLVAPRCASCGRFRMPPTPFCPNCRSQAVDWVTLSGAGTVFSYTVVRRSPFPDVDDFTYVPVVVELADAPGARLVSNLIEIDPGDVAIGMAVQVTFGDISGGWKFPLFRPASS
jgi:uncharacterized OB-fold protein